VRAQEAFEKESNHEMVRIDSENAIITRLSIHKGADMVTFRERL
jgi:hypothetical protein